MHYPIFSEENKGEPVGYTIVSGTFVDDELVGDAEVLFPDGERYVGGIVEGRMHTTGDNTGTYYYLNNDVHTGSWSNGLRNGYGVMVFAATADAGEERYEGEWAADKMEGRGRYTHADGSYYDGMWSGGRMHGPGGVFVFANQNKYTGDFAFDLKHGYGVLEYARGGRYSGHWVNDVAEGEGEVVYEGGEVFRGSFARGLKSGPGELTFTNGDRLQGTWAEDRLDGPGVMRYGATGNVYEGEFKEDLRDGNGTLFDVATNSRFEGLWAQGRRHGPGKLFFADGSCATGEWVEGLPAGPLTYHLAPNSPWLDAEM
jgi:hypothetical protein